MGLTALCPGTFDPVTNGHLDIIGRAGSCFDAVVVGVLENPSKQPLFEVEERVAMLKEACSALANVRVSSFSGLLVEYVERVQGDAVVRGLRAVSDFEFEFQLALMNRKLNERVETIFMMPKDTYTFISSRLVKEIARLGGDVSSFVPRNVQEALANRLNLKKTLIA